MGMTDLSTTRGQPRGRGAKTLVVELLLVESPGAGTRVCRGPAAGKGLQWSRALVTLNPRPGRQPRDQERDRERRGQRGSWSRLQVACRGPDQVPRRSARNPTFRSSAKENWEPLHEARGSCPATIEGTGKLGDAEEEVVAGRGHPAHRHREAGQPGHDKGGDLSALVCASGRDSSPAGRGGEISSQPSPLHLQPSHTGMVFPAAVDDGGSLRECDVSHYVLQVVDVREDNQQRSCVLQLTIQIRSPSASSFPPKS